MYDVSLNGGQVRFPGHLLARCNGSVIDVYQWDEDEEDAFSIASIMHGMPPEAASIDRARLLELVTAKIGRRKDGFDFGHTQDCYGTDLPASPYGRGRTVYNIRQCVAGA